ncbi:hypothetical protein RhiirA4_476715 [Rhizophagus irregularis]|uniref:Uncharacterized protein n=1 Tax=Rhizophagus irregularis TaxID=588596 RepID=A0A2I1HC15_9GLOM|nr:hypothetical protein RhiirA4_476715 [Rhizophagus irregularis]
MLNDEIEKYKRTITDLENRIRELEVDVTVKERIKLEKEEEEIRVKQRKNSLSKRQKISITSDENFLDNNFAEKSHDMTFYDFPWFLKDEDIKKNVGYVEQLRIKRCYNIRWLRLNFVIPKLTKIYINEVAITINGRNYFFRIFDSRLTPREIKDKFSWQAFKKLEIRRKKLTVQ